MPDFGRWTSNGGDPSLNEINRTDRFLDSLASEQPVYSTDPGEAELARLLTGWRDEVRQPPVRRPVTMADAAIALDHAPTPRRRRPRVPFAVVGSVAAAMLCLGGFGAVVYGAGPGDPLYGLRTMLFGAQQVTRDDAVVLAAQTELAQVQQLIDNGQWDEAQDRLQAVTTTVATVDDVDRKQELVDQWQQLSVKVESRDVNATVPPDAPPVTLPEVPADSPLPAIVEPGTTTATTPGSETTRSETTTPSTRTTTPSTRTTTPTSAPPTTVPTSEPAAPPADPRSEPTTSATTSATTMPRATNTSAPAGPTSVPASPTSTSRPSVEAPSAPTTTAAVAPPTTTTPAAASREPASGGDESTAQEAPTWETSATVGRGGGQFGPDEGLPTVTISVPTLPKVELPVPGNDGGAGDAEE